MTIKDRLKEWSLLKTKNDYEFFHRITKMMAVEKIEQFGASFLQDLQTLTDIVKVGKVQDAKIYIDSLEDKERKILAADTYFTMLLK